MHQAYHVDKLLCARSPGTSFKGVMDEVPIARLEAFRALKFSRLKSFRALNPYHSPDGRIVGPTN